MMAYSEVTSVLADQGVASDNDNYRATIFRLQQGREQTAIVEHQVQRAEPVVQLERTLWDGPDTRAPVPGAPPEAIKGIRSS
jgi:hypothetical protein